MPYLGDPLNIEFDFQLAAGGLSPSGNAVHFYFSPITYAGVTGGLSQANQTLSGVADIEVYFEANGALVQSSSLLSGNTKQANFIANRYHCPIGAAQHLVLDNDITFGDVAKINNEISLNVGLPDRLRIEQSIAFDRGFASDKTIDITYDKPCLVDTQKALAWNAPDNFNISVSIEVGAPNNLHISRDIDVKAPNNLHKSASIRFINPSNLKRNTTIKYKAIKNRHSSITVKNGKANPIDARLQIRWDKPRIAHPFFYPPLPVIIEALQTGKTFDLEFYTNWQAYPHDRKNNALNIPFDFRWFPRRTRKVLHTAQLQKYPSLANIPVSSVSLQFSRGDFAWSATLNIPDKASAESIAPTLTGVQEVLLTLDGWAWRFIVEGYSEDRRFNSRSYTVTARSLSAYLAAPYSQNSSRIEDAPKTIAQLMEYQTKPDSLDANKGFAVVFDADYVNWQFSIPAGAFSYETKTPIDVVTMIANANGSIVVPHRSLKSLTIEPNHRISAWNWGTQTPEITLDDSRLIRIGSKFEPHNQYNKVYCFGGEINGVGVGVTRYNTLGDNPAQTVIDNLLTEQNVATEKGRQELSKSGNRLIVTVETPLTPANLQPGLISAGHLVQLPDSAIGFVTDISINASWDNDALSIFQILTLEVAS